MTAASSHAAPDVARARQLANQNACLGCHAVSARLVGPSYAEVAAKYKGVDPSTLAASIKAGGAGKWGSTPMPAQAGLSDADARTLAEWILAGSPDK